MVDSDVQCAIDDAGDSLHAAASTLWTLDSNRLTPSVDYVLNPQSRTSSCSDDAARTPLFLEFSDEVWERPTYRSFKRLLDNYIATTGVPEVVSQEERAEEERFLDVICETKCMKFAYQWLVEYADVSFGSMEEFRDALREMWFSLYRRDASRDSSGFEHVFSGEIDDGKVKGLHNYIQVYIEEQRENFDYMGYLDILGDPSDGPPPSNQQLLTIRFEWLGYLKSVSSMFVGTSPEFEVALYSMLWLAQSTESTITLGPYTARIKIYDCHGKITTAFPELKDVDLEKLAEDVPSAFPDQEIDGEQELEAGALNDEEEFPPLGA